MTLQAFLTLALLVEVTTGIIKSILGNFGLIIEDWLDQAISLVVAGLVAFSGKVDFFLVLNQVLPAQFVYPPFVGILLSALILSRGANAVHDIIKRLNPPTTGQMRLW